MITTSACIFLKDTAFYARHGVSLQETRVGNRFMVNLKVKTDFTPAMETDELTGTVSYADIYQVVKEEMAIPSKLLEHVSGRIVCRLFNDFPTVEELCLKLEKINPPVAGADIYSAGVEVCCKRK